MRRRTFFTAVVGLMAAGFGCRHVGGKCDCGSSPADGVIQGPTAPYPTGPAPSVNPNAPAPIPPATSGVRTETKAVPDALPTIPSTKR
jgi:hypothetical protein